MLYKSRYALALVMQAQHVLLRIRRIRRRCTFFVMKMRSCFSNSSHKTFALRRAMALHELDRVLEKRDIDLDSVLQPLIKVEIPLDFDEQMRRHVVRMSQRHFLRKRLRNRLLPFVLRLQKLLPG